MVSGLLSVGLANSVVQCAENELIHFNPREGETCGDYIAAWQSVAGGKMENPEATSDCNFCAIEDTNVFLRSLSSDYSTAWRNFGILWVYVIFNIFGALALYYLLRMPKPKKEKKEAGAVKEEKVDEPSHVGSSSRRDSDAEQHGEKNAETARYASITGATTPPQEVSEKI
jgi:hypothetical protein